MGTDSLEESTTPSLGESLSSFKQVRCVKTRRNVSFFNNQLMSFDHFGIFTERSTAEFRNAFLKTIRQIIRESVRNMSIPPAKPPVPSASTPPTPKAEANKGASKGKRNVQRHSAGTIDYDNVEACGGGEVDDIPTVTFRGRSNTIGNDNPFRK